jgi:UDP-N-acetylglucosamine 1-carboxyvinyltransferase
MSKMGVEYEIEGNLLKIQGNGGQLKGANVRVLDLRAGAALFLCGLVADGDTYIEDAWQIERGYNNFVEKARSLNAKVERVKVQ